VINRALGGMTTEWALSWFDKYVRDENPDVLLLHFFTNDADNLSSFTFTAPDGSTQPRWPSGLTDAQSQVYWKQNIDVLIARANALGITVGVFMPGGTASQGQSQKHANWRWQLDRSFPATGYNAGADEQANPAAFINICGKARGREVLIGGVPRVAAGAAPSDAWLNLSADSILPIQGQVLRLDDYTASPLFTIGADGNGDGLSNGLSYVAYGANTDNTFTPSIVGGNQRYVQTFGVNGGDQRIAFSFTLVAGKQYLLFAKIINSVPANGAGYDVLSDVSGTYRTISSIGGTIAIAGGSGFIFMRETAAASGTSNLLISAGVVNSSTRQFDAVARRVCAVDIAALLAAAPNLAGYTDLQLVQFLDGLMNRSAAISAPSGGTTVDTESRAAISAILAAMQTAGITL
jgi:hypothetical protein